MSRFFPSFFLSFADPFSLLWPLLGVDAQVGKLLGLDLDVCSPPALSFPPFFRKTDDSCVVSFLVGRRIRTTPSRSSRWSLPPQARRDPLHRRREFLFSRFNFPGSVADLSSSFNSSSSARVTFSTPISMRPSGKRPRLLLTPFLRNLGSSLPVSPPFLALSISLSLSLS